MQIYTGLDLSRKRRDWHACRADGTLVGAGAVPPDPDGLAQLVHRLGNANVLAVVESMNGARFVHGRSLGASRSEVAVAVPPHRDSRSASSLTVGRDRYWPTFARDSRARCATTTRKAASGSPSNRRRHTRIGGSR